MGRALDRILLKGGLRRQTIHNRLLTVLFLPKEHGIRNPLKWSDMPTIEDETVVGYTDQLTKLFATMNEEESIRYKCFPGSCCRHKGVIFTACRILIARRPGVHTQDTRKTYGSSA